MIADTSIKKMRNDLGVTTDSELYVVLGAAEKIREGTFVAVAGDPQVMGEKVLELFDNF